MIKVKVKIFDIEAETVDEAARLARRLTSTAVHTTEIPSQSEAATAASAESEALPPKPDDPLLGVADLVREGLAPTLRVPRSGRTVRNWIRSGKIPRQVEGYGLEARWRRSQFTETAETWKKAS